jgi:diacylglycerol kinase (ATP)
MWLLVLNRSSGKGNLEKKLNDFLSLCKSNEVTYEIIDESSAFRTSSKMQEFLANQKIETLVAFGGDGLVSLCIQHITQTSIGFTVVPTGTGNDFARSIGTYRKSVSHIFNSIRDANKNHVDVAVAQSDAFKRYFVQVLSIGFDATVNELANQMSFPKGKSKYTIAMLRRLPKARNTDFEIVQSEKKIQVSSMLIAVANGATYGGGMRILPDASFHDGKLNLLYVDPVSKITLLSIFPRVFRGTHIKHPAVHVIEDDEFQIFGPAKAYADGELIGNLPIRLSVLKDGLTVWECK